MKNEKIFLVLAIFASLMLLGCTAIDEATSDLEDKAKTTTENETEVEDETQTEEPTLECEEKYWFDSESTECGYKEFCGMYMYNGLRTFDNLEDCEAALALRDTEEISTDCLDMDEEDKWDCLINKAEDEKNIAICNQITPTEQRNTCIATLSQILQDIYECDKLNTNDDQQLCRYHSGIQASGGLV